MGVPGENILLLTNLSLWSKLTGCCTMHRIAKIFVYKHCFCYLNVDNVKQKNSLFLQEIAL